jgi:hypothetical protein
MILNWAEEESAAAIDRLSDRKRTRKNNIKKISIVCRALVDRKKPIRPSAEEVAESGSGPTFGFDEFPSKQTIYNDYSDVLSFWRKAYDDIKNLDAVPSSSTEELLHWNPSDLDAGSVQNVEALKQRFREQRQANNALRRIIADHVPIDMDRLSAEERGIADDLEYWMSTIEADGFVMTEMGLVVSPRSSPGSLIMDRSLWDGLKRLVEIHQTAEKSRSTLGDDGPRPEPA